MTTPTTSMIVSAAPPSGELTVDALLMGIRWGAAGVGEPTSISFSFAGPSSAWYRDSQGNYSDYREPTYIAGTLNEPSQAAVREALARWGAVAQLAFTEIVETPEQVGDVRFGLTEVPAIASWWGWTYAPTAWWPPGGDVWINPDALAGSWQEGGRDAFALTHEIGHALGLKHLFDGAVVLQGPEDTRQYSLMSYNRHPASYLGRDSQGRELYVEPSTPMLFDIAAMQYLYGSNTSYRSGNDRYEIDPDLPFLRTLWDAGGRDAISAAQFTVAVVIDLNDGNFSSLSYGGTAFPDGPSSIRGYDGTHNLAIAFGVSIEIAIGGAGDDLLIGNEGSNRLDGGPGADTLVGGSGGDLYVVDNVGDVVSEEISDLVGGGFDRVLSYLDAYTLGAGLEVLLLKSAAMSDGTGNDLNNRLISGAGDNRLDGGDGTDRVSYRLASAAVTVSLDLTGPQDTKGSANDQLIAIEGLQGSAFDDLLSGDAGPNGLLGMDGDDTLSGAEGRDRLRGGRGDDVLSGEEGNDLLEGGSGRDTLSGGLGGDKFVLRSLTDSGPDALTRDVITDFQSGLDLIDLSKLDADAETDGWQGFSALTHEMTGWTGPRMLAFSNGVLWMNVDADADAEVSIELIGVNALTLSDLLLQ